MHIVITAKQLGEFGGVARSTLRIAESLRRLGHRVELVAPHRDLFPDDVRVDGDVTWFGARPADLMQAWSDLLAAKARQADWLVGMYATSGGAAAVAAGERSGVPVVVALRGNDFERDAFDPVVGETVQRAAQRAAVVTAVSSEMAALASRRFEREVSFISNSVDPDAFRPDPEAAHRLRASWGLDERPIIGMFGELKPKRGVDRFADISRAAPQFQAIVVGRIRPAVRDLLPEGVRVFPPLEGSEHLRAAYSMCDAVLHPSRHDGMPNVVLEAMACGRVVVCAPVGGIRDIVENGANGFLCDDLDDWLGALRKVEEGTADSIGEVARRSVPQTMGEARAFEQLMREWTA